VVEVATMLALLALAAVAALEMAGGHTRAGQGLLILVVAAVAQGTSEVAGQPLGPAVQEL